MKRFDLSKFLFYTTLVLLTIMLSFGYGYNSHKKKNMIHDFVSSLEKEVRESFTEVKQEAGTALKLAPDHFLQPSRVEGDGVTINRMDAHDGGLVFLSGFFDRNNELRLIDRYGNIVARWPIRFSEIFARQTHRKPFATDWNVDTHGALILPDGSVVFNFEYGGTAKLDRCGNTEWWIDAATHHSVELAEGGGFWIPVRKLNQRKLSYSFFPFRPQFQEDFVLRVSPDGEILSETSVPGIFYRSGMEATLTATGYQFGIGQPKTREVVHLNKIAELSSRDSDAFPLFEAGDLLLSIRDYNTVLVVDPDTMLIKWSQTGPWIRQHDPEYSPDGLIEVFNNNVYVQPQMAVAPQSNIDTVRHSNIVAMNPVTREATITYGDQPGQEFLTTLRGKFDRTPSGGFLITEFEGGRVIEVNDAGETIWEYVNRYDDNSVAEITEARLYSEDYFTVSTWQCEQ